MLQNNPDLIIKEADGGGNVVSLPINMYTEEAERQLSNIKYYSRLPSDPTMVFKRNLIVYWIQQKAMASLMLRNMPSYRSRNQ